MTTKKPTTPIASRVNRDVFFQTSPDLPQIIEVEIDQVVRNPNQPRKSFSEESLQELASSIERHGLIQPISVKKLDTDTGKATYLLVAGERRFRAFQRLGRTTIPAIVTTGDADEIALIENIQREDLNPLEEAEAMSLMMEQHRYTQEQLGQIIGKAQNTVSQFLGLLKLPEQVKEEYRAAPIASKSVLMEVARGKTEQEQIKLWRAAKEGRLTVKAARERMNASDPSPRASDTEKVLASGSRFVKGLEALGSAGEGTLKEDEYGALLELRKRIDELIDTLSP
jgi:ParB family chromosome partitioning protein